jgi:hypothetical protein
LPRSDWLAVVGKNILSAGRVGDNGLEVRNPQHKSSLTVSFR